MTMGTDNTWDSYADNWDSSDDVNIYANNALDCLVEIVDLKGLNVLDFGCGTGLLSEKMATLANHVVAFDTSEKMISVVINKNIENVTAISKGLTYNRHSYFDLIVASSVFAFLPEYEQTLLRLKPLITAKGLFVQWDWFSEKEGAEFALSEKRISGAFIAAGFHSHAITQPFSLDSEDGVMPVIMGVAYNN